MEKTIEQINEELERASEIFDEEALESYYVWMGLEGNASKENLDEYYEWLNNGGYEEVLNDEYNEK